MLRTLYIQHPYVVESKIRNSRSYVSSIIYFNTIKDSKITTLIDGDTRPTDVRFLKKVKVEPGVAREH